MTRYVSVLNGTVTLAGIAWDGVTPYASPDGGTLIASDTANVGDTYDGTTFTPGPPPAPVVPATVTAAQLRLALANANLLNAVNAAVAAASQESQTYWGYAKGFDRTNPLVTQIGAAIGQTSAQMDAVFIQAGTYPDV